MTKEIKIQEKKKDERSNYVKKKQERGITTIALVITIIILLILAGIGIATLTGENGILTKATNAQIQSIHQQVYEELKLKVAEYVIEQKTGVYNETLIQYLLDNQYIEKKDTIEGYIINVENLSKTTLKYGNGTDGKTDVYKIELIEEGDTNTQYKVEYYGTTESENVELGTITDGKQPSISTP